MTTATNNSITGISTSTFQTTDVVNKQYIDTVFALPSKTGNSGKFLTSTNGVTESWDYVANYREFTSTGSQTFVVPTQANILFIEAIGAGGGGSASDGATVSGAGGGAGSYTSWYIPINIISSNLTVIPGTGGSGGTTLGQTGSVGGGTTITWTGPGGTYTLTTTGGGPGVTGGAAQTAITGYFYTTVGGAGGAGTLSSGLSPASQANQYQATGGGSGGYGTFAGGPGGIISIYGSVTFASGGTSAGTNGSNATAITGLPYGYGGGGGGGTTGNGGNGVRGSGGGGGGGSDGVFANGGNGGNGYVRITWW
jgi:hypothetical protein